MTLTRRNSFILFAALSSLTILAQLWVVKTAMFTRFQDVFAFSVTVDIAICVPLLYYFFIIRKKLAPPFTILMVFVSSIALTYSILPTSHETYVGYLAKLFPVLEMVVLGFVIRRVIKVVKDYRRTRKTEIYFTDALEDVLKKELGDSRAVGLVFAEVAFLYYAVTGWFKSFKPASPDALYFSYHRRSSLIGICGLLLIVFIGETFVLHIIVQMWSTIAAWILTTLGIYSVIWLLGAIHAFRLQPIALDDENIYLRTGLFFRAVVPLEQVTGLEKVISFDGKKEGNLRIAAFSTPNFALSFKDTVTIAGPFGIEKKADRVGVFIDEAQRFEEEMNLRGVVS